MKIYDFPEVICLAIFQKITKTFPAHFPVSFFETAFGLDHV